MRKVSRGNVSAAKQVLNRVVLKSIFVHTHIIIAPFLSKQFIPAGDTGSSADKDVVECKARVAELQAAVQVATSPSQHSRPNFVII